MSAIQALPTSLMTAEEFCDWVHQPENQGRWFELVRGRVIPLPGPNRTHGVVGANCGFMVSNYTFQVGKYYVACNDSGVILERDPDTVRGPDVAVYDDASTFAELHPKYGEVPPRVAIEVLSASDRWNVVLRKIMDYLRSGVQMVWLIDPANRDVAVYRPGRDPVVLDGDQELSGDDVLPGFTCKVSDFFRLPGEKPAPTA
jgi:Uma2 family endonuclease